MAQVKQSKNHRSFGLKNKTRGKKLFLAVHNLSRVKSMGCKLDLHEEFLRKEAFLYEMCTHLQLTDI